MYYSIIRRAAADAGIEEQTMPDKPENSAFKLLSSRKTLVMATADKNGAPNVTYAPFVHRAPPLYVYTSSLSRHTRNMMETARASVMFIEDEARTRNFFARKRFTCQCSAESVGRETEWRTVMSLFKRKFGKVFGMIRRTQFELAPLSCCINAEAAVTLSVA
jgi:putative heme iron utilization protein